MSQGRQGPRSSRRRESDPTPGHARVADRLEYPPPVADWLAFLAELLEAEFLREITHRSDPG